MNRMLYGHVPLTLSSQIDSNSLSLETECFGESCKLFSESPELDVDDSI